MFTQCFYVWSMVVNGCVYFGFKVCHKIMETETGSYSEGRKDEIGFAGGSVTLPLGKFQWGFSLLEGTVQYSSLLCRRCGPGKNQLYTASPIQMSFNHSF